MTHLSCDTMRQGKHAWVRIASSMRFSAINRLEIERTIARPARWKRCVPRRVRRRRRLKSLLRLSSLSNGHRAFPFVIQWRSGVQEHPAKDAEEINGGGNVKGEGPVLIGPSKYVPNHQRAYAASQISHHIHAARKRSSIPATNIHARSPASRHN